MTKYTKLTDEYEATHLLDNGQLRIIKSFARFLDEIEKRKFERMVQPLHRGDERPNEEGEEWPCSKGPGDCDFAICNPPQPKEEIKPCERNSCYDCNHAHCETCESCKEICKCGKIRHKLGYHKCAKPKKPIEKLDRGFLTCRCEKGTECSGCFQVNKINELINDRNE